MNNLQSQSSALGAAPMGTTGSLLLKDGSSGPFESWRIPALLFTQPQSWVWLQALHTAHIFQCSSFWALVPQGPHIWLPTAPSLGLTSSMAFLLPHRQLLKSCPVFHSSPPTCSVNPPWCQKPTHLPRPLFLQIHSLIQPCVRTFISQAVGLGADEQIPQAGSVFSGGTSVLAGRQISRHCPLISDMRGSTAQATKFILRFQALSASCVTYWLCDLKIIALPHCADCPYL